MQPDAWFVNKVYGDADIPVQVSGCDDRVEPFWQRPPQGSQSRIYYPALYQKKIAHLWDLDSPGINVLPSLLYLFLHNRQTSLSLPTPSLLYTHARVYALTHRFSLSCLKLCYRHDNLSLNYSYVCLKIKTFSHITTMPSPPCLRKLTSTQ